MSSDERRLVILGATGTIGVQAQEILRNASSPLRVVALSAHSRVHELAEATASWPECRSFATSDPTADRELHEFLASDGYDICLNGVVGAAGLPYSQSVLAAGRQLALANKESLVMAGELLAATAASTGGSILPVDSEHSAIHQCLAGRGDDGVRRLYLTASGGALRDMPPEAIPDATPAQVLAHPNWDMGPRITVDSATMINKALEVLEAHHLFGVPAVEVEVLLHRQSVVHSMVEFVDGSMLAQLGPPDMAFPIHYALHYPDRVPSPLEGFDPQLFSQLTFERPDAARYPALELGWRAAEMAGAAGAVLNAADEIAVEAFLEGHLNYGEIASTCARTLDAMPELAADSLEAVYAADRWAREQARQLIPAVRS